MAHVNLNRTVQLSYLLELGKDYCSDHLGRFFQNKYSLPANTDNKFEIPARLAAGHEQDGFAVCVIMNNHIVDLKYFSEIFPDWNHESPAKGTNPLPSADKIDALLQDERLISIIKRFKKTNDEIVIGRCKGLEFTPIQ